MYIFVGLLMLACLSGGFRSINRMMGQNSDWIGEEILEEIIELNTGLKVDLTPESYEDREEPWHQ